jgi:hypothetical protein
MPLFFIALVEGVGGVVWGRGMNSLPVEIELEPPASGVLGTGVVPVVYEVSQGGAVEAFEREAFGVEVFLL